MYNKRQSRATLLKSNDPLILNRINFRSTVDNRSDLSLRHKDLVIQAICLHLNLPGAQRKFSISENELLTFNQKFPQVTFDGNTYSFTRNIVPGKGGFLEIKSTVPQAEPDGVEQMQA